MTDQPRPTARPASDFVLRELDSDLLVYDLKRHRASALDPIAAAVWQACDGGQTPAEIARHLSRGDAVFEEATVWAALKLLDRERLLADRLPRPVADGAVGRRAFVGNAAKAAMIAVPAVMAISAPTPAQAASCVPSGSPCNLGNPGACCSLTCLNHPGGPICA
jgi:hypothetical protein